jgi:hypothetical protein
MDSPDSIETLRRQGFAGFLTVGQLHRRGCLEVPDEPGVYVVLARERAPHPFFTRSTAPVWRRRDPTVTIPTLAARWRQGATILYVAAALGPGVRSRLRQRIKRMLRFGHGSVVAHWGGRLLWQLGEAGRLVIAWQACATGEDARAVATELLRNFEAHHGGPPFANEATEDGADDDA